MIDSSETMALKDSAGNKVATYTTIDRLVKDEDGEYVWERELAQNSDASKNLSIPTNLELSEVENGNVAIIRYQVATKEFAYIYKTFNSVEELNEEFVIPDNMQKVTVSEVDGNDKLDKISSKLWMIKAPMQVGDKTIYATANNLQVYKYNSVYLEPGNFVIEGNYVSLPDENAKKSNYYFLKDVTVEEDKTNGVVFDKNELAKVTIEADSEGFSDVRGAIVYPYNKYSDSFTKTLRVGHEFYVQSGIEMDLQVQLGYGDTESKNKIWNYFLTKGDKTFTAGEEVKWQVGGNFSTHIKPHSTTFQEGNQFAASTSIEDAYDNTISSVLVNETTDYSIASKEENVVYQKLANGQIIEKIVESEEGEFTINHSAHAAVANSFEPVLRIYDTKGKKVFEKASLDYYSNAYATTGLLPGTYRAELAMVTSPKGAVVSSSDEGLFTITSEDPGEGSTNPGNESGPGSESSTTPKDPTTIELEADGDTFTYTFTEETLNELAKSTKETVTLTTKKGIKLEVPIADLTSNLNGKVVVNVSVKDGEILFKATCNGKDIKFAGYVVIQLDEKIFDVPLKDIVIFRVEDDELVATPFVVKDGNILLKTKTVGVFVTSTANVTFGDISKDGHKEYIEQLAKHHIIFGITANTFNPKGNISRAQFATMMARALGIQASQSTKFTDVKGRWYEDSVQALFEAGIIKGVNAHTFKPNDSITRQQAALMTARMLEYASIDLTTVPSTNSSFKDMKKISAEAQEVVAKLQALSIFNGNPNGEFAPQDKLTRSQMAKILYLSLKKAEMM